MVKSSISLNQVLFNVNHIHMLCNCYTPPQKHFISVENGDIHEPLNHGSKINNPMLLKIRLWISRFLQKIDLFRFIAPAAQVLDKKSEKYCWELILALTDIRIFKVRD